MRRRGTWRECRHDRHGGPASRVPDLPTLRGHLWPRDHPGRRRPVSASGATVTTSSATGSSARRARRSSSSTRTPTGSARPVVRTDGGTWREVSWDEAFAEVERLPRPGPRDATAATPSPCYLGNPSVHNLGGTHLPAARSDPVHSAPATSTRPAPSTRCRARVVRVRRSGARLLIPVPDLDRTDFLSMLGANPFESNGSLCTGAGLPRSAQGHPRARAATSWSSIPAAPAPRTRPTSTSPSVPAATPTCCWAWSTSLLSEGLGRRRARRRPSPASRTCRRARRRSPPTSWPT